MANEFKVKKGLVVDGTGTVLDIQGTQGQLFSVTDSLTGDLFSVSDISGVPIFNVNSSGLSTFDGDATFTGTIRTTDGSAATPAYNFSSHTGNGMYLEEYDASNNKEQISISTDGARRFRANEAGIWSDQNVYFTGELRKFGEWKATSGTSGQGFVFRNTADSIDVLSITSAGNATFAGNVTATATSSHSFLTGNTNNTSTADTTGFRFHQSSYTDGRYTHRFRKYDNGGGVPLYIDGSSGTANIFTALARFGTYTGESKTLEVFGTMGATNFSGSSSGTNTGDQTLPTLSSLGGATAAQGTLATNALPKAGGVMSGDIGRNAHNKGFLVGGYNNVGASPAATNPIFTIGTSYLPAVTTLGNMYGIGYTRADASFMTIASGSGWGMYVAADGDARVWLDGSSGDIVAAGDISADNFSGSSSGANTGDQDLSSYLTASSTQAKYLRSDAADTATGALTISAHLQFGNCTLAKSGDNNHIHVNCPTALIPNGTTLANNTRLGTASYRWKDFHAGPGNFLGSVTASADVVAYSDIKLKENIKTLDGSKVLQMRGVSFDRKDNGASSSGVIAQEMQKVAPELVSDDDGTLGVAYGNITGYLIEAIKEQQKQINELKKLIENGNNL